MSAGFSCSQAHLRRTIAESPMPHYERRLNSMLFEDRQVYDSNDGYIGRWKEPPLGSHVVTSRRFYLHHGIYVGGRRFIHYAGFTCGLSRGPVEEVSIERFSGGHAVWIRSGAPRSMDCHEVVKRARSRLGENSYRLLSNNCFHFCKWCFNNEKRRADSATGCLSIALQCASFLRRVAKTLSSARALGGRDAARSPRSA